MKTLLITPCLRFLLAFAAIGSLVPTNVNADGPADNRPDQVRPIPPPGIELTAEQRGELQQRVAPLRQAVQQLRMARSEERVADAEVLLRAVEMALEQNTFFAESDLAEADKLLKLCQSRIDQIAADAAPSQVLGFTAKSDQPHLLVAGYVSKIDRSVQPYGLVIPANLAPDDTQPRRLDVWLHGRGEKSTELQFIDERLSRVGQISPADTLVLHPFGRYCNAFKFAGETDVLEAIADVQRRFAIDPKRITIRGFSMGGAGCWQLAVHYPGLWMAATPGAGFSETREFLKLFQGEAFEPTAAQAKLLAWYDCPPWTNNLRLLPTIAYSGEIDRQKQAADVMEQAFADRGLKLRHLIGPQTAHKLHPDSLVEIEQALAEIAAEDLPTFPPKIDFTTYTLRYSRSAWLQITGMEAHWQEARVQAELAGPGLIRVKTEGVTAIELKFPAKESPLSGNVVIDIDGTPLAGPEFETDGSWVARLVKQDDAWWLLDGEDPSLRKRPGLQGPIDDAFSDPFTFVMPSRPCTHGDVERWVNHESKHAMDEWRRHFRGDVRSVTDGDLKDAQVDDQHLVLFGDPSANQWLAKIAPSLPIQWNRETITVGDQTFDATKHALVMIYPNPLNPSKYVVLNSGFTFREYAYLNNARQIAMLPDWAVIDVTQGADSRLPGKVVAEGFFDEQWRLTPGK